MADIRREYGNLELTESSIQDSPILQFNYWFEQVIQIEPSDPTAMVLSTVDEEGHPDSRVVLLKGIEKDAFVFFTNYLSTKGKQLSQNNHAALNFYWPNMARQVRIRGTIKKTSSAYSDAYFTSRPFTSQLGALVSPQSQPISSRMILEEKYKSLMEESGNKQIKRPLHWGGYLLEPEFVEFWQGRDNRLHDRILYIKSNEKWDITRLAP